MPRPARRSSPRPALVVLAGGRNRQTLVAVPRGTLDEARMEASVARDERVAHVASVRQHARAAMRALAESRFALAGMWLVELDRLNEREAIRARSIEPPARPCPDGKRQAGHGEAA